MHFSKISIALCLVCLVYCSTKNNYPQKIETIDGVKTITNPDYPRDGKVTYDLSEELSIGLEDGDVNYILNRPQDIKVTSKGSIYILDWGDIHIKVFSKHGHYLRTIGRKGQGPGEFNQPPLYFDLTKEGKIYVDDNIEDHVYDIFSPEGMYLKQVTLKHRIFAMKEGKIYSIVRNEDDVPMVKRFKIIKEKE